MIRPDHLPAALTLQKSRPSAWIQLVLSVAFGIGGIFSAFLAYFTAGDLGGLIAGLFAFSTICVAGTFAKSSLDTLNHQGPWLVIDGQGITDIVRNVGPVPWHQMQTVKLDNYENQIIVNFHRREDSPQVRGRWTSLIYRWQNGGDLIFPLGGLAYDTARLKAALQAFHAAAKPSQQ